MKIEVVAKTIILNADGRLLILRRHNNDTHRAGMWDLPGGQVDIGEAPIAGAVREAYEETNLHIQSLRPVHIASKIHGQCQVIKAIFTTTEYHNEISLSEEHSEYAWISIEDFLRLSISSDYKAAARLLQSISSPAFHQV